MISLTNTFFHAAVQIFLVEERQHWIATSLIRGDVYLFDSSFNGHIDASAELHIAQMYQPLIKRNSLLVKVAPIQQQQPGSNNCGLFSIAAAYHAVRGDDIETIAFDERKMRAHLSQCFENKQLSAFPTTKAAPRPKHCHITIPVYCPCLRLVSFDEMIQCDRCDVWYHYKCVNIKEAPRGDWFFPGSY